MTSPSWPVIDSWPLPGTAAASMKSTSPPTGVQARPVATPGTRVRRLTSAWTLRRPSSSATLPRLTLTRLRRRPLRDLARDLAADRADLALELADAGLARVAGDDLAQRRVGDLRPGPLQPVALDLARDEVALGDLELLVLGVARDVDDLHPVQQRAGDAIEVVRGADEHDRREVERQVEVVIAERLVLLGVEHLEHRARRVAAEVRAHLVDLVDHEERVARAGVAQRADDDARHRPDVRAPVAADLGLVAHAADADALELAAQRAGDRAAERRLADAGRADEAQDRALRVRVEAPDGEELEDAVLHRLQPVVVGVEHLARVREVEVVLGRRVPRQLGDPLEVRADDAVLGGLRREVLEAVELAVDLPAASSGSSSSARRSRSSLASAALSSISPSSSWMA